MDYTKIRNFCIIAHIDHGKSTLADRLLELTQTVERRKMREQILDAMELERERGITIKAKSVRMNYKGYQLNLIDTPGHVDFTYEVSRSLAACEGALLVVDATQGVEAQTIANLYLALDNNLEILPVINKIDMVNSDVDKTINQLIELGLEIDNVVGISAKTGENVEKILDLIIEKIPAPKIDEEKNSLKCLIFDSHYDSYQGVILNIRLKSGVLKKGMKVKLLATASIYTVTEVGIMSPDMKPVDSLNEGEVGYCIAGIKYLHEVKIGDTLTEAAVPCIKALPGFKEIRPVVFCGFYPINADDFELLRDSLAKLQLNDSAFTYVPETSAALGFGFKCGFLGLLHLEIIAERLHREFDMSIVMTTPGVLYKIETNENELIEIDSAYKLPDPSKYERIYEPYVKGSIIVLEEYVGNVMKLCEEYRAIFGKMEYIGTTKVILNYQLPLGEIIIDFYDRLKSVTKGYGSFDYELSDYKVSDLVKLGILINNENVDALSIIVHKDKAYEKGKNVVEKLKELIPRQQFSIPIQAAIGSRIIARETIKAFRKDVTSRCYGGDITRKRKLLERQKEGKKKMKQIGNVSIPKDAFLAALRIK
ncbi:MAG TPA: translation elongation factor 4 [bacterium]|nr:translation elongation factor 4 [bacterium]